MAGRAGEVGRAYTLVTRGENKETEFVRAADRFYFFSQVTPADARMCDDLAPTRAAATTLGAVGRVSSQARVWL